MLEIEFTILDFIQSHLRSGIGDFMMTLITTMGNGGALWIILSVILMISRKYRRTGFLMISSLIFSALICNIILKPLVARPRPCDLNTAIQLLIVKPDDFSFPSGHTASSFAAVTAAYLAREKYWYITLIPASLIAFSRLYLYVHYPTDIIGGIVFGVLSGILAYFFEKLIKVIYKKIGE